MKTEPEIRTLGAGKFKATCLQLMDEVLDKGLTVIITKRGKAVAQLGAPTAELPAKATKPVKPAKPAKVKTPKTNEASTTESSVPPSEEKHAKKKDKSKKKKHK
jgi:antitoxin (DNA-binding transcriptional repressor) of toxin-antitoxin stability system